MSGSTSFHIHMRFPTPTLIAVWRQRVLGAHTHQDTTGPKAKLAPSDASCVLAP